MSKKYVKIWEEYHHKKLDKGYEIHHIDGNHTNNNPDNLLAVTIEEHLEIHKNQHDYGAVQAILMRLGRSQEVISDIKCYASKNQQRLWIQGNHNFQKISNEDRIKISSNAGLKTKELQIGIHKINANPILAKENARRGGLRSAELKSGFLDTTSTSHGSNHVKNTFWWIHPDGSRKRSPESPGIEWIKGMKK